jgi:hypothetical protein
MAEYTYEQLHGMTVAELREVAKGIEHEALQGHSTMHKEQLLPALCKALDIHVHHEAVGAEKPRIKATIRKLKVRRDEAKAAGDHKRLGETRHQIHVLKRRLRKMAHA